jgi:hypothetical protein
LVQIELRPALRVRQAVGVLLLLLAAAIPAKAQPFAPSTVSTVGYINGNPLTTHTTTAVDTRGASTLLAFVSSHPSWNGLPVSISGVSDNQGNTWQVLTGPTTWAGSSITLMSAIYYVQVPLTSATHTVTATLTNGAPVVMHVIAVSGSDITAPPTYAAITGPSAGPTTDVLSAPITVPSGTLLYTWAKNESAANAVPLDGFSLDPQSTSFLWAASQTAAAAGTYRGHFAYDQAIGWQTAVVGLRPATGPTAFNQTVVTTQNVSLGVTLTAVSPNNFPLTYQIVGGPTHGTLSGTPPAVTYTPTTNYVGPDAFTFTANDGTGDSNVATISITVQGANHAPVAQNGSASVTSGVPGAISLTATDADNNPLTYTIVTPPAHGTLAGTGASRTYTSAAGYVGGDSFTFKANDGFLDSNLATVTISVAAQATAPAVVGSRGYINGNPLATHTTTPFDSRGATTLVAFVSTHPAWNGLPIDISTFSDNAGNTWQLLRGPTTFVGPTFTLASYIYYTHLPSTSATFSVTATLSNPAPLVMHVTAVAGTDITTPPTASPIANPAGPTTDVTTPAISMGANARLLAWAKNESSATAVALDAWTLDTESTSFLWAETETTASAGSFAGHFSYTNPIVWQSAIVGLGSGTGPIAFSQAVTTTAGTPVGITLVGTSPNNLPLTYTIVSAPTHGTLAGIPPSVTYTPANGYAGGDIFTFKVNDGSVDSNTASVNLTVLAVNHPPVASDGTVSVEAGSSAAVTLVATDPDNNPLTYAVVSGPTHGTLTGVAPNLLYTPATGFAGTDAFVFTASDGIVTSNQATISLTVTTVPPAIIEFTPLSGMVGASVTINGTSLLTASAVRFNGTLQPTFTTGAGADSATTFATNAGPIGVTVGDLDGDGKADIAVVNQGFSGNIGNTVSVLRNNSVSGTVSVEPKVDFFTSAGPHDINIADIDGDGKPDLVTSNYGAFAGGTTISVLRNTSTSGTLSFDPAVDATTPKGPPELAIGDLDGDGKPDVVVTGFDDGRGATVSVLRNTSTAGVVSFAPRVDLQTPSGPYGVAVGDLDGDGKLDILVAVFGSLTAGDGTVVSVFRNTSTSGQLSFAPRVDLPVDLGPRSVAVGDLDGDGRLDIVTANYGGSGSNHTISVIRNLSAAGTLTFSPAVNYSVSAGPIRVLVHDVTGDGRPDVIVANYANGGGNTLSVLRNVSTNGILTLAPRVDYPVQLGPHGVDVGDIDGDGRVDLISSNYGNLQGSGTTISVLRLDGGDSHITTTVPAGATSGPITVVNAAGSSTSANSFTVLPPPSMTINDVAVNEGNSGSAMATFTVTLSAPSPLTITVNYATVNGTATAGADYTATSGALTFPPGSLSQSIAVPVLGDTLDEVDETFTVNLSGAVNAIIADATGVATILDDDPPPALTINDVTVTETNGGSIPATFTVTLSAASGKTVTVDYATADGTATAGSDYTTTNGTLTFAPGTLSRTIAVPVLGDRVDEPTEFYTVNLSGAINATIAKAAGTGTILDNDQPSSLSINNVSVTEGDTGSVPATFTVTLSAASGQTVTVNYQTANGTATAGSDYTATSGTLTFAPGTVTQSVVVPVLGDTLDEPNETFTVALSGAVNATIANGTGTGTIVDNDPTPSLTINSVSVTEGNTGSVPATFTVTLSAASGQTVTVNYQTANGTATAGSDYTATSGTLTFAPGVVSQSIVVAVLGDTVSEPNETFTVNLSGAVNATIATTAGTGTIVDNDGPPSLTINNVSVTEGNTGSVPATFTVTLSAASGQTVTVNYQTANGTATAGSDYTATSGTLTFAPGTVTQSVVVPVLGDTLDEPNETFTVTLSGAVNATIANGTGTGTIVDNDPTPSLTINNVSVTEGNTGSVPATFTVTLSAASGQTVTVNYQTANGTATAGSDYTATSGTLTFAPGVVSQSIVVAVLGDTVSEPNETFTVNLSGAVNATIATTAGTGTIVDNDPPPSVTITINNVSVTEGNTGSVPATFTVTLSAATSQTVTVNYQTANGTATAGSDYTATSGTLTFAPGTVTQSVVVPVLGDTRNEADETFTVNLSGAVNATIATAAGIGTIVDNDPPPSLTINNVTVTEANNKPVPATFTVTLSAASGKTVTVNYQTANGTATAGSDYTATSGTLTFAPGVVSQPIVVSVLNDSLVEPNETFTVNLSGVVNATIAVTSGTGTIISR